jgi:hypothetical protein
MHDKPILIINFYGVLGLWKRNKIYLRHGVIHFIRNIRNLFQVVIVVTQETRQVYEKIGEVDAIYKTGESKFGCFYDQIYKDFKIKPEDIILKVLVVASVDLDEQYSKYVEKDQILFEKEAKKVYMGNRGNWNGIPLPSKKCKSMPVTILVQNMEMCDFYLAMSMKELRITPSENKPKIVFDFKINEQPLGIINTKSSFQSTQEEIKLEHNLRKWKSQSKSLPQVFSNFHQNRSKSHWKLVSPLTPTFLSIHLPTSRTSFFSPSAHQHILNYLSHLSILIQPRPPSPPNIPLPPPEEAGLGMYAQLKARNQKVFEWRKEYEVR